MADGKEGKGRCREGPGQLCVMSRAVVRVSEEVVWLLVAGA